MSANNYTTSQISSNEGDTIIFDSFNTLIELIDDNPHDINIKMLEQVPKVTNVTAFSDYDGILLDEDDPTINIENVNLIHKCGITKCDPSLPLLAKVTGGFVFISGPTISVGPEVIPEKSDSTINFIYELLQNIINKVSKGYEWVNKMIDYILESLAGVRIHAWYKLLEWWYGITGLALKLVPSYFYDAAVRLVDKAGCFIFNKTPYATQIPNATDLSIPNYWPRSWKVPQPLKKSFTLNFKYSEFYRGEAQVFKFRESCYTCVHAFFDIGTDINYKCDIKKMPNMEITDLRDLYKNENLDDGIYCITGSTCTVVSPISLKNGLCFAHDSKQGDSGSPIVSIVKQQVKLLGTLSGGIQLSDDVDSSLTYVHCDDVCSDHLLIKLGQTVDLIKTKFANGSVLVQGGCGSGKSTDLVAALAMTGLKLIVTQPLKSNCIGLHSYMSRKYPGLKIGVQCSERKIDYESFDILYCTRFYATRSKLSDNFVVVIDEYHVVDQFRTTIELLNQRVIKLTATPGDNKPDVKLPSPTPYPIEEITEATVNLDDVLTVVRREVDEGKKVLCFLPSKNDCAKAQKDVKFVDRFVTTLTSDNSADYIANRMDLRVNATFCTAAAENGITCDFDVVVDTQQNYSIEGNLVDPKSIGLTKHIISQASIQQRKGRVGRLRPGKYIKAPLINPNDTPKKFKNVKLLDEGKIYYNLKFNSKAKGWYITNGRETFLEMCRVELDILPSEISAYVNQEGSDLTVDSMIAQFPCIVWACDRYFVKQSISAKIESRLKVLDERLKKKLASTPTPVVSMDNPGDEVTITDTFRQALKSFTNPFVTAKSVGHGIYCQDFKLTADGILVKLSVLNNNCISPLVRKLVFGMNNSVELLVKNFDFDLFDMKVSFDTMLNKAGSWSPLNLIPNFLREKKSVIELFDTKVKAMSSFDIQSWLVGDINFSWMDSLISVMKHKISAGMKYLVALGLIKKAQNYYSTLSIEELISRSWKILSTSISLKSFMYGSTAFAALVALLWFVRRSRNDPRKINKGVKLNNVFYTAKSANLALGALSGGLLYTSQFVVSTMGLYNKNTGRGGELPLKVVSVLQKLLLLGSGAIALKFFGTQAAVYVIAGGSLGTVVFALQDMGKRIYQLPVISKDTIIDTIVLAANYLAVPSPICHLTPIVMSLFRETSICLLGVSGILYRISPAASIITALAGALSYGIRTSTGKIVAAKSVINFESIMYLEALYNTAFDRNYQWTLRGLADVFRCLYRILCTFGIPININLLKQMIMPIKLTGQHKVNFLMPIIPLVLSKSIGPELASKISNCLEFPSLMCSVGILSFSQTLFVSGLIAGALTYYHEHNQTRDEKLIKYHNVITSLFPVVALTSTSIPEFSMKYAAAVAAANFFDKASVCVEKAGKLDINFYISSFVPYLFVGLIPTIGLWKSLILMNLAKNFLCYRSDQNDLTLLQSALAINLGTVVVAAKSSDVPLSFRIKSEANRIKMKFYNPNIDRENILKYCAQTPDELVDIPSEQFWEEMPVLGQTLPPQFPLRDTHIGNLKVVAEAPAVKRDNSKTVRHPIIAALNKKKEVDLQAKYHADEAKRPLGGGLPTIAGAIIRKDIPPKRLLRDEELHYAEATQFFIDIYAPETPIEFDYDIHAILTSVNPKSTMGFDNQGFTSTKLKDAILEDPLRFPRYFRGVIEDDVECYRQVWTVFPKDETLELNDKNVSIKLDEAFLGFTGRFADHETKNCVEGVGDVVARNGKWSVHDGIYTINDTLPRLITHLPPLDRVNDMVIYLPIHNCIVNTGGWINLSSSPKQTAETLLKAKSRFKKPVIFAADQSKLDGHINLDHIKYEFCFYSKFYIDPIAIKYMMAHHKGLSFRHERLPTGHILRMIVTRPSGDLTTSDGNSFIVCCLMYIILRYFCKLSVDIIVNQCFVWVTGDDSVVISEEEYLAPIRDSEALIEFVSHHGFTIKDTGKGFLFDKFGVNDATYLSHFPVAYEVQDVYGQLNYMYLLDRDPCTAFKKFYNVSEQKYKINPRGLNIMFSAAVSYLCVLWHNNELASWFRLVLSCIPTCYHVIDVDDPEKRIKHRLGPMADDLTKLSGRLGTSFFMKLYGYEFTPRGKLMKFCGDAKKLLQNVPLVRKEITDLLGHDCDYLDYFSDKSWNSY